MAIKNLFQKDTNNDWAVVEKKVRKEILETLQKHNVECIELSDIDELFDVYQNLRIKFAKELGLIKSNQSSTTA